MSGEVTSKIIPVILCGGSGTRLWPISREGLPKQFLKLGGNENSLLQATASRALACSGARKEDVITVTLEASRGEVERQLKALDPTMAQHVLCEPSARNTAAAVALAAYYAFDRFGADAVLWVLPADHHVGDEKGLSEALQKAVAGAREGRLVTFGITPSRPETGYGYIAVGHALAQQGVYAADAFVEKPNRETAERYVDSKSYVWNSGMFVFRAGTVLDSFQQYAPDIAQGVRKAVFAGGNSNKTPSPEIYSLIEKEPFDKAIMEKSSQVAVVPCDVAWSDIGSWESLWEICSKDVNGNAVDGNVMMRDSRNCMILSQERLVACSGLENIVVAETGDAVLVADKRDSDGMKHLVTLLKNAGRKETANPVQEDRPWGSFKVLSESVGYKIKEISVRSGEKLSLQVHTRRAEFWVVVQGEALVTVNNEERHLKEQESIYIPLQAQHRLANPGKGMLRVIEVQCGEYLGEDDIIRLEDIYGREAA